VEGGALDPGSRLHEADVRKPTQGDGGALKSTAVAALDARTILRAVMLASEMMRGSAEQGARTDPSEPLDREAFADAALRSALGQFGLGQLDAGLDYEIESGPEVRRLLVQAVLSGARGAFALTRHQRRLVPAAARGADIELRDNAASIGGSVRYELVGRACTKLGLIGAMSPAGYRSLFSR
jgi:hypothetical protein